MLLVCAVDHRFTAMDAHEWIMIYIHQQQRRGSHSKLKESVHVGPPDPEPTKALIPSRDAQHPDRKIDLCVSGFVHWYLLITAAYI